MKNPNVPKQLEELIALVNTLPISVTHKELGMSVKFVTKDEDLDKLVTAICNHLNLGKLENPNWEYIQDEHHRRINKFEDGIIVNFYSSDIPGVHLSELYEYIMEGDAQEIVIEGVHVKVIDPRFNTLDDLQITIFEEVPECVEDAPRKLARALLLKLSSKIQRKLVDSVSEGIRGDWLGSTMELGHSLLIVPFETDLESVANNIREEFECAQTSDVHVMSIARENLGFIKAHLVLDEAANCLWLHIINELITEDECRRFLEENRETQDCCSITETAQANYPITNGYRLDKKTGELIDMTPYRGQEASKDIEPEGEPETEEPQICTRSTPGGSKPTTEKTK